MRTRRESAETLRLPQGERSVRVVLGGREFQAVLRDARTVAVDGAIEDARRAGDRLNARLLDPTTGAILVEASSEVVNPSDEGGRLVLSLDDPAPDAPADAPEQPPSEAPVATRPVASALWRRFRGRTKIAAIASVWVAVGSATIGYAGTLLYANVVRLEVDAAVVAGSLEPIQAATTGAIVAAGIRAGDRVSPGQKLFVVQDPEIERQISLASLKLERARQDLTMREREADAERGRREDYRIVARAELSRLRADIAGLEQQAENAAARVARFTELYAKGYASRQRLEDALNERADLASRLARARIVERERIALMPSIEEGRYYDGKQLVGRTAEAEAAEARARAEVDIAAEELGVWMSRRTPAEISSPGAGRIVRVLRGEGATVKQGDTLAVFDASAGSVVHAFLTQEEVVRVAVGDEAAVFIPALRAQVTARVAAVERAAGYLDDVESRYTWRTARDGGPRATEKDRTARVTLALDPAAAAAAGERLEPGLPAIVSFRRQSTNTVVGGFAPLSERRGPS